MPHTRIAYLKLERTHHASHSFSVLWKQVLQFSESYELLSKGCKYVSLTLDYPFITSEEQSRFMVGVTLPQSFKIPKGSVFMKFLRVNMLYSVLKDYTMN